MSFAKLVITFQFFDIKQENNAVTTTSYAVKTTSYIRKLVDAKNVISKS